MHRRSRSHTALVAGIGIGMVAALGLAAPVGATDGEDGRYQADRYVKVVAGGFGGATCGLTEAGAVRCWGSADDTGDGAEWPPVPRDRLAPIQVVGLESGVTDISGEIAGMMCALIAGGEVKCWGRDGAQILFPDVGYSHVKTPMTVPGLSGPATAISVGFDSACAVLAGGALECWGINHNGTVGDGTKTQRTAPVRILEGGVTAVSGGGVARCAVQAGALKCWGQNSDGQLGNGTRKASLTPTAVTGLASGVLNVTAGAVGDYFCARTDAGAARCWGSNTAGRLGIGTTNSRLVPTQVRGLTAGVTDLTAGGDHTCAIVSGTAKCWGRGYSGALGDGSGLSRLAPGPAVSGMRTGAVQIDAGAGHTCAVVTGHVAKCWGSYALGNRRTRMALRPSYVAATSPGIDALSIAKGPATGGYDLTIEGAGFVNVTSVLIGGTPATNIRVRSSNEMVVTVPAHAVGAASVKILTALGHSVGTEYDDFYFSAPSPGDDFVQVSAGRDATCGVKATGELKCWGGPDSQIVSAITPVPATVAGFESGVRQVAVGVDHACFVTTSGAAYCWGGNYAGQLGQGTTSEPTTSPGPVSGLSSGVHSMAVARNLSCAILDSGALKCWGSNYNGTIGDGTSGGNRLVPTQVTGMTSGVTDVAPDADHVCAVRSGAAYCWGDGEYGKLGDGVGTDGGDPFTAMATTPVRVVGMGSGVTAVSVLQDTNCAVRAQAVSCWGSNYGGQLGAGSDVYATSTPLAMPMMGSGVTEFASAGYAQMCAVKAARLYCWGSNELGQVGIGDTTHEWIGTPSLVAALRSGVHGISTSTSHSCVIGSDGADYCWGGNAVGQLGDGTSRNSAVPSSIEP